MTEQQDAPTGETAPQCGFHAHNPIAGTLGQCTGPAERDVVVAVTMPGATFRGDGVRVGACERHAGELEDTYKAVPVGQQPAAPAVFDPVAFMAAVNESGRLFREQMAPTLAALAETMRPMTEFLRGHPEIAAD